MTSAIEALTMIRRGVSEIIQEADSIEEGEESLILAEEL